MQKNLLKEQYQSVVKELSNLDLRSYNRELKFYSSIQQEMSIPWTKVMEQLGDMIPDGVRIQKMASVESSSSADSQSLQFLARARSKKDQLVFLSALRDHPDFNEVLLKSEVYEGLQLQFEFTVQYAALSDETISNSDGGEK
jgi:Tfp pilus assembly protein PilN